MAAAAAQASQIQVSVLMAAFECEAFVGRSIASALAQTLSEIEVVVVDDGSTDGTWAEIQRAARQDPRVVAIRHASNRGAAAARNTALGAARGDWVAVLDSDDAFLPARLATLVSEADALGADLLADNLLLEDDATGRSLGLAFPPEDMACHVVTLADFLEREEPGGATGLELGFVHPLIRRAFLIENSIRYAEHLAVGEDFALYAECLLKGARFMTIPEAFYVYHLRPQSLSRSNIALDAMRRANQHVAQLAADQDRATRRQLRARQNRLDFAALLQRVRAGHLAAAGGIALALPKLFLVRRLAMGLMRPRRRAAQSLA